MTLPNIMEKVKIALSSAWLVISWEGALISYYVTEWCGLL
jgi:hypothetical protein